MAEQKMNDAVKAMMDRLDKSTLRTMQKDSYLCSAKCFDNANWSAEQMQGCVERCQNPMQQVQQYMQQEMESFQNRLQRCAMDCQDRAKDSLPSGNPSESEMAKVQSDMEKCVSTCVDSHIKLLPNLEKRITDTVKQSQQ